MAKITKLIRKFNIWMFSTIFLLSVVVFLSYQLNRFSPNSSNDQKVYTLNPTQPSQVYESSKEFDYPGDGFFSRGKVSITGDPLTDGYFTITLKTSTFTRNGVIPSENSYKIPLKNIDYISDPKVSHDAKYGCITVGGSGYSGYYIFTLPNGDKIDQGIQYSQCVEWINDHQVIIAESEYKSGNGGYYIYDTNTKSKQKISSQ